MRLKGLAVLGLVCLALLAATLAILFTLRAPLGAMVGRMSHEMVCDRQQEFEELHRRQLEDAPDEAARAKLRRDHEAFRAMCASGPPFQQAR